MVDRLANVTCAKKGVCNILFKTLCHNSTVRHSSEIRFVYCIMLGTIIGFKPSQSGTFVYITLHDMLVATSCYIIHWLLHHIIYFTGYCIRKLGSKLEV